MITYLFDSTPSILMQWFLLCFGEPWIEPLKWSSSWLAQWVANGFFKSVMPYLNLPLFASLFHLVTSLLLLLIKFILVDSKDEWLEFKSESKVDTLEQLMKDINEFFEVMGEPRGWQHLAKVSHIGCMLTLRISKLFPDLDLDITSDQPKLLDLNAGKLTVSFQPDDSA